MKKALPKVQGRQRPGRPRHPLPEPTHQLTKQVRLLIDKAHGGNLSDASRLTGISYPLLRDLYVGRVTGPSLRTLEALQSPYGVDLGWLTEAGAPDAIAVLGWIGLVPPGPTSDTSGSRKLREVLIPFLAWPMYELVSSAERHLREKAPRSGRPIVGEATGDAFSFRLTTFLLQPLLAAEKLGSGDAILTVARYMAAATSRQERERWITGLRHLGGLWRSVLPATLGAE